MAGMRRRGVLSAAMLASVLCLSVLPASAAPPTTRTVDDPVEPARAYDIVRVTLSAAPAADRKAKIVVDHGRRVQVSDGVDVWIDTDDDRQPDIVISGISFSEYGVRKARGWDRRGRDITARGCATLKMTGRRSVVRIDTSCFAPSKRFAVSVRSFAYGQPASADDYAPRAQRLTKKVLSYVP